jgi:hypothetical protein
MSEKLHNETLRLKYKSEFLKQATKKITAKTAKNTPFICR